MEDAKSLSNLAFAPRAFAAEAAAIAETIEDCGKGWDVVCPESDVTAFAAGRPDAGWRRLRKILPWTEARGQITGEPFVINNGYHGPRAGQRAGESDTGWITGAAGWVCRALVEGCLGLKPTLAGLQVRPCLPSSWSEARVVRRFRGTPYEVEYRQSGDGTEGGRTVVCVDGKRTNGGVLPVRSGQTVKVVVAMEQGTTRDPSTEA